MINRQHFQTQCFRILQRGEQLWRVGGIPDLGRGVDIFQRIDFARAIFCAGNNTAGFIGRIVTCLRDQLHKLFVIELHCAVPSFHRIDWIASHNRLFHTRLQNLGGRDFKNVLR